MSVLPERPHVWRPAAAAPAGSDRSGGLAGAGPSGRRSGRPLLLLHGTGADEHTLLPLAERLSPTSAVLSVRGTVRENGMNRYFRRLAEGVLDEADLVAQTHALADFVRQASAAYGAPEGGWVPVGFSNGANMANSLLMLHPELVAGAVAFAAMRLFAETPQVPAAPRRALIVNGDADELVTAEMTDGLVTQLGKIGTDVRLIRHPGGHEIPEAELDAVAAYIATLG